MICFNLETSDQTKKYCITNLGHHKNQSGSKSKLDTLAEAGGGCKGLKKNAGNAVLISFNQVEISKRLK